MRVRILVKASQGGVVRVGEGVQVLLSGHDRCMAQPLLGHLEVSATSQQPRRVGMSQVMHAWLESKIGCFAGWCPDAAAEPVTGDVFVSVGDARPSSWPAGRMQRGRKRQARYEGPLIVTDPWRALIDCSTAATPTGTPSKLVIKPVKII